MRFAPTVTTNHGEPKMPPHAVAGRPHSRRCPGCTRCTRRRPYVLVLDCASQVMQEIPFSELSQAERQEIRNITADYAEQPPICASCGAAYDDSDFVKDTGNRCSACWRRITSGDPAENAKFWDDESEGAT